MRKAGFDTEMSPLAARLLGLVVDEKKNKEDKKDGKKKSRVQGSWSAR